MSYSPFYIFGFEGESGLNQYYEPFLIPDKAFPQLEDAYAWRGRIRKRQGFTSLGRLQLNLSTITLSSQASGTSYTVADLLADSSIDVRSMQPNAEIKAGSLSITVGSVTFTDSGDGTLTGSPGGSGTINYVTGALSLTFASSSGATNVVVTFSYYPALPVMGMRTRETLDVNLEETIAFDTIYAYRYVANAWEELPSTTPMTWNGADYQLFWTTNYWENSNGELLWATNNNKGTTPDPIAYYDGVTWTTFAPVVTSGSYLQQCLILIPYKNRLLALNTWEGSTLAGATQYPQRLRWSQNGDPTNQSTGWTTDVVGKGGYLDATTNQQIISVEFVKDQLIVKFERSSYKIVYTGNELIPFLFQKINTELGAESTFSLVPFDRGVFCVGNYGITTDDSVNVSRIDEKIPDFVFGINNDNQGTQRVYGIRDYNEQLVYWSFPNADQDPTFPNQVLVYNYINATYAIFNDSFTCFGYWNNPDDVTWATLPYSSWNAWNEPWGSAQGQAGFPDVCAGNQQGYTMLVMQQGVNDVSLSITAITPGTPVTITVPNHNLQTGSFATIINIIGSGSPNPNTLNGPTYFLSRIDANTLSLQLYNPTTANLDNVILGSGGTYLGGGQLAVVNNINITTKVFSPYYEDGKQVRLGYVDYFLDSTTSGQVTVQMFINESPNTSIDDPNSPGNSGLLGDNILLTSPENLYLIPYQENQRKIWHRQFYYTFGQNFQVQINMDAGQMSTPSIAGADFVMHALTLYFSRGARMTQ